MHEQKPVKGGVVPTFQMDNKDLLHFYGDTIELTDSKLKLKAIYKKVRGLFK